MTTELTKAAQQAISALRCAKHGHCDHAMADEAITALEALTQRPAAQTEREAWVPYLVDRADGVKGHYAIGRWNPRGYREVWNLHSHRWAAYSDDVMSLEEADSLLRQITIPTVRASLPAPQQATPEPDDDAQIRAIGEGLRSAHDHIEMHRLERSHCKDAERIREGLAAFYAYKKRGDFTATPEPMREAVHQIRGDAFDCPHAWRDATEEAFYMMHAADRRILYTRPAPGVPDGWRIEMAPQWSETRIRVMPPGEPHYLLIEPGSMNEAGGVLYALCRAMLAASQANGGEQ